MNDRSASVPASELPRTMPRWQRQTIGSMGVLGAAFMDLYDAHTAALDENERLREALKRVANSYDASSVKSDIARNALEGGDGLVGD